MGLLYLDRDLFLVFPSLILLLVLTGYILLFRALLISGPACVARSRRWVPVRVTVVMLLCPPIICVVHYQVPSSTSHTCWAQYLLSDMQFSIRHFLLKERSGGSPLVALWFLAHCGNTAHILALGSYILPSHFPKASFISQRPACQRLLYRPPSHLDRLSFVTATVPRFDLS